MNPESSARIIRESRIWSTKTKTIVSLSAGLLLAAVAVGGFFYLTYQPPAVVPTSYGLDAPQLVDAAPYGQLLVSAEVQSEDGVVPQMLQYDFADGRFSTYATDDVSEVAEAGGFSASIRPGATSQGVTAESIIVSVQNMTSGEVIDIASVGQYNQSDVAISPTGDYVAYSFQTVGIAQATKVTDSNIALYNRLTTETYSIPAAAKPIFMQNGTEVLYLGDDGIYKFDLTTKISQQIYATSPNLQLADNFTISNDSDYLVMTFAGYNTISVASNISEDSVEFSELGAVVMPGTVFTDPVISEDGRMYAVQARSVGQDGPATIEIRSLENRDVITAISADETIQNLQLKNWVVPGLSQLVDSPENITNFIQ